MGGHKPGSSDRRPGLLRDRDARSKRDDCDAQSASRRSSVGAHCERSEDQAGFKAHAASCFGRDCECHPKVGSLVDLYCQQALLTALSPVLLSLTNLTTLDMSPTTGASTSQVQEELMLCQTWSKYCGLQKVVFPSGDVWIQPRKGPELFDDSGGWTLVGGTNIASQSRRSSSEFASIDNGAGGHNDPLGELSPPSLFSAPHTPLLLLAFERSHPTIRPATAAILPMTDLTKKSSWSFALDRLTTMSARLPPSPVN